MDCTDEADTQLILQHDFTQYSPPEMVAHILEFLDYEDIANALAVNKQWYILVSRLIADIICEEFWAEKVSEDHARINIRVARDTEHTLLNYRLHHLAVFAKLELRINYSGYSVIKDWPQHIAQLASLQNLINLELIEHPDVQHRYNWRSLSVLTNLQRLLVDCRHINYDWLPSGLRSLELHWATLSSGVMSAISHMPLPTDLCLDYVIVEDQLSLNMSLLRLRSQLTSLMFRDRIAEEVFTHRDNAKQLLRQGPTSWVNFAMLTALETLQLFSASVNSLELISSLTPLTSLALLNPYVDISFFRPLSHFTNLRSFTANTIDYTFTLLKWMTPLTNLEELSLTNCKNIVDSDLQGLTIFPSLTRLVLSRTSKLTADCFEYLLMLTSLQQVKLRAPSFGKETTSNMPFSVCID